MIIYKQESNEIGLKITVLVLDDNWEGAGKTARLLPPPWKREKARGGAISSDQKGLVRVDTLCIGDTRLIVPNSRKQICSQPVKSDVEVEG